MKSPRPHDSLTDLLKKVISNTNAVYTELHADDATYDYVGYGLPGTTEAAAGWRIKRVHKTTGTVQWSSSRFDHAWTTRGDHTYS